MHVVYHHPEKHNWAEQFSVSTVIGEIQWFELTKTKKEWNEIRRIKVEENKKAKQKEEVKNALKLLDRFKETKEKTKGTKKQASAKKRRNDPPERLSNPKKKQKTGCYFKYSVLILRYILYKQNLTQDIL